MSTNKRIYSRLVVAFLISSVMFLTSCRVTLNGGGGRGNHGRGHGNGKAYVPLQHYSSEESPMAAHT